VFATIARIPGEKKARFQVSLGETKLLLAPKVKVARSGSVTLDDDQLGYEQVWMRRVGEVVGWFSSVTPNFRTFGESALWFRVDEVRAFATSFSKTPDAFVDSLGPVTTDEAAQLLRAAVAALDASPRVTPAPSWQDLERLREYAVSDPDDARLMEFAGRIPSGTITLHEVAAAMPEAVSSLVESYELSTGPEPVTRLVATSSGDMWHLVGSGCWGRISVA
jgi:hypothetical protein